MKRSHLLLVALLFPAWANATGDPPMIMSQMIGQALSRSMVTYPMYPGELQLKVAPGYIVAKDSRGGWSNDLKGGALTAAATYGLGRHWSVSWMAGYAKESGEGAFGLSPSGQPGQMIQPISAPGKPNPFQGHDEGNGFMTSVGAVWDHWTGDNFRLPVYMGLGFLSLEEKVDNTTNGLRRSGKVSSPTVSLGVVPGVNLGKLFRFTGYFMLVEPLDAGSGTIADYNPATGRVITQLDYKRPGGMESAVPVMGIELTYRPWGLGVGYSPAIEGATSYSLKWTRRWGPQAEADVR